MLRLSDRAADLADLFVRAARAGSTSGGVTHAGLAVVAADTGRLLMLQRSLEDDDPAAGRWEFPGGGLEAGENPLDAAKREWSEETGCQLPGGELTGQWHHGIYCGYVWQVGSEADVPVFGVRDSVSNPDDPDGDKIEALAWFDREQLTGSNPGLRDELRASLPKVFAALGPVNMRSVPLPSPANIRTADHHSQHQARDNDGQFTSGAPSAAVAMRQKWRKENDPLQVQSNVNSSDFVGSARIGQPDAVGLNMYAEFDSTGDRYLVVANGSLGDAGVLGGRVETGVNDEYTLLTDEQFGPLRESLTAAAAAVGRGDGYDRTIDGNDQGDLRITVDPGGSVVKVSAFSWSTANREQDDADDIERARQEVEEARALLDPVEDKAEILGRWPVRDDFATDAEFQDYVTGVWGDETVDEYLDSIADDPYLADVFDDTPTIFAPIPAAELSLPEVQEFAAAIDRLTSGQPYREVKAPLRAAAAGFVRADGIPDEHGNLHSPEDGKFVPKSGVDRRGRLIKTPSMKADKIADLLATFKTLAADLSDDEDDDWDISEITEKLESLRDRKRDKAKELDQRRDADFEAADHGTVNVSIMRDGQISIVYSPSAPDIDLPAATVKELVAGMDELRTKLPPEVNADTPRTEVVDRFESEDGYVAVEMWDDGYMDIGDPDEVGDDDREGEPFGLQIDEVPDFTDLLEELADRSLGVQRHLQPRYSRSSDHWKGQPRDPGGEDGGQWAKASVDLPDTDLASDDSDDDDSPAYVTLIRNERVGTAADYNVAAVIDTNGVYGPKGARVIGVAEYSGLKDWEDDGLDEAWAIPEKDVDAVATALESMSQQASAHDGGGPKVIATAEAAGFHFAALAGDDGTPFVGWSYGQSPEFTWDADGENQTWAGLTPEDTTDLAEAMRHLRTAGARPRTADPKLDKSKLDGRIDLAPGHRLIGSQKLRTDDGPEAVLAAVAEPGGPALAIIPADEDFRTWEGAPPLTLSGTELAQFRQNVADLPRRRKEALKKLANDFKAADDAGLFDFQYNSDWAWTEDGGYDSRLGYRFNYDATPEQKDEVIRLNDAVNGDFIERGVLAAGPWGELRYEIDGPQVSGDDDDYELDASHSGMNIGLKPPDAPDDWTISTAMWEDIDGLGFEFTASQMAKFVKAVEQQATLAGGAGLAQRSGESEFARSRWSASHLRHPGHPDQKVHGRKKRLSLDVDVPEGKPAPAPKNTVPSAKATVAAKPGRAKGSPATRNRLGDRRLAVKAFDASEERGQWAPNKVALESTHNDPAGHLAFHVIADAQGFNALPKVVTSGDEWARLQQSGRYTPLFRGNTADGAGRNGGDLTREFIYGGRYAGSGFATGTNMSPRINAAGFYADNSSDAVGAFLLPKTAKVAEFADLIEEQKAFLATLGDGRAADKQRQVFADLGNFGAAAGYQAMRVPEGTGPTGPQDEWVIFDRGALLAYDHRGDGKQRFDASKAATRSGPRDGQLNHLGRARQAGVLARGADQDVSGWNAKNPRNPKDADGKWTEAPGGAARLSKKVGDWFRSPEYKKLSTGGHIALDVVGLAPGFGEPFDLANAAWYLAERKPKDALLSLGSAVPGLGYVTSVAKVLKHIRTARNMIKVRQEKRVAQAGARLEALRAPMRSAAAGKAAFGIPLDGSHDSELAAELRNRWGTDPRPWAVLHAHITRQAGEETADDIVPTLFIAANGEDALEASGKRNAAGMLAVAIIDAVAGHTYTPQQLRERQMFLRACTRAAGQPKARTTRLKAPRGPRVGVGVPFKKNDEGQWVDRYGQYADLPDVPKRPAATGKTATAAAPKSVGRKKPGTAAHSIPQYVPPASLSTEEQARANTLVRKDPTIFASAKDRIGPVAYAGNLSRADEVWLQAVHDREPAFINRLAQTAQIDRDLRRAAKKAQQTPAALKKSIASRLKERFDGKPVAVRVRDEEALQDILAGGRFKTAFDAGVGRAPGLRADLTARRLGEQINGVDPGTPPDQRPVYGYVAINGIEPALAGGTKTPGVAEWKGREDALSAYGKIQVVLKPDVRARTTATVGDSLDEIAFVRPTPLDNPGAESVGPSDVDSLDRADWTRERYVEAQIHGGVRKDDIAEVVFDTKPARKTANELSAAGISWRVLERDGTSTKGGSNGAAGGKAKAGGAAGTGALSARERMRLEFSRLTAPELRKMLRDEGVPMPAQTKKADLVDLLLSFKAPRPGTDAVDVEDQPDVKSRIQAAYDGLPKGPAGYVGLADLRERLVEVPRAELDAALRDLALDRNVHIVEVANRKSLKPRDHAAALAIGEDLAHMLSIDKAKPTIVATPADGTGAKTSRRRPASSTSVPKRGETGGRVKWTTPDGNVVTGTVVMSNTTSVGIHWDESGRTEKIGRKQLTAEGSSIVFLPNVAAGSSSSAPAMRTPEQMIADPQSGDREQMQVWLKAMTVPQLKKWAADNKFAHRAGVPKPDLINDLVYAAVGAKLDHKIIMSVDVSSPLSPKNLTFVSPNPRKRNTWGSFQEPGAHTFHPDGAIGGLIGGADSADPNADSGSIPRGERKLQVRGDSLENVLGDLATDTMAGRVTPQKQLDELKAIAAELPEGTAKRAIERVAADLDAPSVDLDSRLTGEAQVALTRFPALQALLAELNEIPLARGGTLRGTRGDTREFDKIVDALNAFGRQELGGLRFISQIEETHNLRHESNEGKQSIDRAVQKAIKALEAQQKADRQAFYPDSLRTAARTTRQYSGPTWSPPAGVSEVEFAEFKRLDALVGSSAETADIHARWLELLPRLPEPARMRARQEHSIEQEIEYFRANLPGPQPSTTELRDQMTSEVRNAFDGKKIGVRVTAQGLAKLLADGRFKTQFEGGKTTGGTKNQAVKLEWENTFFGIPVRGSDAKTRPVYGYVILNGVEAADSNERLNAYGTVQVVLKDAVRERTTAMFGDSLYDFDSARPSPINNPTFWSYNPPRSGPIAKDTKDPVFRRTSYAEAQVHGGVPVADIEEVLFPTYPSDDLVRRLEKAGVKWRVI